jgi:hypothetical protein
MQRVAKRFIASVLAAIKLALAQLIGSVHS